MKIRVLPIIVAACIAGHAPTLAQQRVEPTLLSPFTARQLVPGIHRLGTPSDYFGPVIGNVTVIEQSDGVVVVDSGGTVADGRRIVAFVRSLTDKPVRAVVITHWHSDHPAGVSAIREAWPSARVISTARTRANLLGPGLQYLRPTPDSALETASLNQFSAIVSQLQATTRDPNLDDATRARIRGVIANYRARMADISGTRLVAPTETFTDRLRLDDATHPVELLFLGRANTDGDAIAWLPRQRVVVTGDVVVSPIPFGFFSYPRDWIGALERIKALDFAILVPGHGEPQTDTAYLDRLIGALTDVRARIGTLAGQDMTLEQVRERADFSEQVALFADNPRARAAFQNVWLTPIVESAFREARGEPITQGTD